MFHAMPAVLTPLPRRSTVAAHGAALPTSPQAAKQALEMATKRAADLRLALPGSRWQVLELDCPTEAVGIYGLTTDRDHT